MNKTWLDPKEKTPPLPSQIPDDFVLLPRELTAENGAKGLLSGEFMEQIERYDHESDQEYTENVSISWPTIKEIYKTIVANFALEKIHKPE